MMISHHGKIVTVFEFNVPPGAYADTVDLAHHILSHFPASSMNIWGCDGIGYSINQEKGLVRVNKSTVGSQQYKRGLDAINSCLRCQSKALPEAKVAHV